ncbi:TetR/AcrR family transcriptional regulator [Streptomyces evansiae]|uniref:TetR/AcrR family transcriptional regulator n=1 Tax=Streptomyces evansiae TaxID=3075535 RepID=UPI0028863340|nr:TetR/AcrR family transcriptional regulator [Streptomyces sp. DSM 41859]MDT0422006.1 TetR/AcrR family transcriptional regulator [Streptomyces sp. DSM 41859]
MNAKEDTPDPDPNRTVRPVRRRLGADERRAALLEAARAAFRTRAYTEVSVAEIAHAAGASEALAHRYFGSKSALYAAMVTDGLRELLARDAACDADPGPEPDGWARLRASLRVYLGFIAEGANGWATLLRAPGSVPPEALAERDRGRAVFHERVTTRLGLDAGDPAVRLVVDGYLAYVDNACLRWWEAGCPEELRSPLVESAVGALTGALAALGPVPEP